MIILTAVYCWFMVASAQQLDFFTPTKKVFINQENIITELPLFLNITPKENIVTNTFTSAYEQITKPLQTENINVILKSTLSETLAYVQAILSILENRQQYIDKDTPTYIHNCTLTYGIITAYTIETFTSSVSSLSNFLPTLTPLITQSTELNTSMKQYISIAMQFTTKLKDLLYLLQRESDDLELYNNRQLPQNIYKILQTSKCIKPNLKEHITIRDTLKTQQGLQITITIKQFQTNKPGYTLTSTPTYGYIINFENTILINNELKTINCTHTSTKIYHNCKITDFNPPCNKALVSKDIKTIIQNCRLEKYFNAKPTLTRHGILIPNGKVEITLINSTKTLPSINKDDLPFLLQTNTPVKLVMNDKEFSFDVRYNTTTIIDMYLTATQQTALRTYLTKTTLSDYPMYISISISLILLTCLIIAFGKNRHPRQQPNNTFIKYTVSGNKTRPVETRTRQTLV